MHLDPQLPGFILVMVAALGLALLARHFRQPLILGYLAAGILLGPDMLGLAHDRLLLSRLGEAGIVILLFLIGLDMSVEQIKRSWRVALVGTLVQISASLSVSGLISLLFGWPAGRALLIGFIMALSSTAVILGYLRRENALESEPGRSVLAILIAQDIAIVPMMILLAYFAPHDLAHNASSQISSQIVGGLAIFALMGWITYKGHFSLPLSQQIKSDTELRVLFSLIICFGMASFTGLMGLSTALGAFAGGMIIHAAREAHWMEESLKAFHTVFMAAFFIAIGMLMDFTFLKDHALEIFLLCFSALSLNSLINMAILERLGGLSRTKALMGGAMLAQMGEFGFVLAGLGAQSGLISAEGAQLAMTVITISLALSPAWIGLVNQIVKRGLVTDAP